jgi:hypothetical protein
MKAYNDKKVTVNCFIGNIILFQYCQNILSL